MNVRSRGPTATVRPSGSGIELGRSGLSPGVATAGQGAGEAGWGVTFPPKPKIIDAPTSKVLASPPRKLPPLPPEEIALQQPAPGAPLTASWVG